MGHLHEYLDAPRRASLAADPNAALRADPIAALIGAPIVIQNATVYRARCGERRPYLSLADAYAYERGHAAWPDGLVPMENTPAGDGYADAKAAHVARQEGRS